MATTRRWLLPFVYINPRSPPVKPILSSHICAAVLLMRVRAGAFNFYSDLLIFFQLIVNHRRGYCYFFEPQSLKINAYQKLLWSPVFLEIFLHNTDVSTRKNAWRADVFALRLTHQTLVVVERNQPKSETDTSSIVKNRAWVSIHEHCCKRVKYAIVSKILK